MHKLYITTAIIRQTMTFKISIKNVPKHLQINQRQNDVFRNVLQLGLNLNN